MQPSQFPIEKAKRRPNGLNAKAKQRPVLYAYLDSPATEGAATPCYDSLLEYWRVLVHHKMTLLAFGVFGLFAAILVSFLRRPTYRLWTSLQTQGANFVELRAGDHTGSRREEEIGARQCRIHDESSRTNESSTGSFGDATPRVRAHFQTFDHC